MKISVIGLGKIGLPLAVQYATKGHEVVGVDISAVVVDHVQGGRVPFPGEAHLPERLSEVVASGSLRATTDYADAVAGSQAVVLVVPLVVDHEGRPDFAVLDGATRALGEHLTADTLVAYETTLPVGTTRGRWKPLLENVSGLQEGRDFHVVFSPERVLTGRVFADLRRYPKLVGGLSPEGAARAAAFYEQVLDFDERADLAPRGNGVWDLGSAEAAEMAKLAETTYRDVNIALANQFAVFAGAHGIDVSAVIDASNSQPYSHIHRPGIAVGGHCIPVYPRLYLSNDPAATVVRAARDANEGMPRHAVRLLEQLLGDLRGSVVGVLGAAYRGGVKETAFSGVFPVVRELRALGADPRVQDPLLQDDELRALGLKPYADGTPVDALVVQADHAEYALIGQDAFPGVRAVVDGRRILDPRLWPDVPVAYIGAPLTSAKGR